jgi:hypothetical protein
MNKIQLAFLKSHIKWAIYELECANKMKPNTVDVELIIELKLLLENIENQE